MAAGGLDRGPGQRLALGVEVPGAGEPHHPGQIAAAPVALGFFDQLPLERSPHGRCQRLLQHPVAVEGTAAAGHDHGRLRQAQLPPGFRLPGDRLVVPLHKQRPAALDRAVAIAAVVDHHVHAAALAAPALGLPQVPHTLAGADLLAARVVAMGEGPQAGGGGVLAQQGEEAMGALVVDGPGG